MTVADADPDCLFCKIVAGVIPATVVAEDELTFAFRDIAPQAPVHVLIVPKRHVPNVAALATDPELSAAVLAAAAAVAEKEGIAVGGYRTLFNTGADAGQTVFHAHAHVLGGRALGALA